MSSQGMIAYILGEYACKNNVFDLLHFMESVQLQKPRPTLDHGLVSLLSAQCFSLTSGLPNTNEADFFYGHSHVDPMRKNSFLAQAALRAPPEVEFAMHIWPLLLRSLSLFSFFFSPQSFSFYPLRGNSRG